MRKRCQRFIAYDWAGLYEDSAGYAPGPFDPATAAMRDTEEAEGPYEGDINR